MCVQYHISRAFSKLITVIKIVSIIKPNAWISDGIMSDGSVLDNIHE